MDFSTALDPNEWLQENGGLLYVQLKRKLEQMIADQSLPPGTALPPEREIAKITGLSRVTVRRAIAPLVKDGLIEQRQGAGSIVVDPVAQVEQSLSRLTSFSEDMSRRGMRVTSKWLRREISFPSPEEIMTLGLRTSESVARLDRLRFADGTPMAIERAVLPQSVLKNPKFVTDSLYDTLDTLGKKPVRAIQHIKAAIHRDEDAELLRVEPGQAALHITRISYMETGQVVELTKSVYRGDAYDFVAELEISKGN